MSESDDKHEINIYVKIIISFVALIIVSLIMIDVHSYIQKNNYCIENNYYGVYIKSEKGIFSNAKDYFCIINEGDTYLSLGAKYINFEVEK